MIRIPRPKNLRDAHALLPSILRGGRGLIARKTAPQVPDQLIELYEFEGCPLCRKVRDALTELDLSYISRSSGKGGDRTRAIELGGKAQFPLLVDPNSDRMLYESEAIVDYLYATYCGKKRSAWRRALSGLDTASSVLASASRIKGNRVEINTLAKPRPAQLLELWSFEASPYCRRVREELTRLGLDSVVHNVGKGGRRRPELVALGGKMQVPYLVDPNTGVAMYESDDIVAYLREAYG